jgi:hypothetical protein
VDAVDLRCAVVVGLGAGVGVGVSEAYSEDTFVGFREWEYGLGVASLTLEASKCG